MNPRFEDLQKALEQRTFQHSKPKMLAEPPEDPQRRIIASRKYNGNCAALLIPRKGTPLFYTVGNYPLAQLEVYWAPEEPPRWRELPPETLLLGEIHIPSPTLEDSDQLQAWYAWHMGRTEQIPQQRAAFRAFDVLAWHGRVLMQAPYAERWAHLPEELRVEIAPYTTMSEWNQARQHARERQIEGYVFWDASAPSYCRLQAQSTTPRGGAWKIKPSFQEIGQVHRVLQAQPERLLLQVKLRNRLVACGSGLTFKEREHLLHRLVRGESPKLCIRHYGWSNHGLPDKPVIVAVTE